MCAWAILLPAFEQYTVARIMSFDGAATTARAGRGSFVDVKGASAADEYKFV